MSRVNASIGDDGTIILERAGAVLLEIPVFVRDSSNPREPVLICEFRRKVALTDGELHDLILFEVVENLFRDEIYNLYWEFVDLDESKWSRGPMSVPLVAWTSTKHAWPPGIEGRPTQLKDAPRGIGLKEVGSVKGFRSFLTAISATPDGRFITAHGAGVIQLVDPTSGKKETVAKLEIPMGLGGVWKTEAGVVVAQASSSVHVLNDGDQKSLEFNGIGCAVSPDGTRVALGNDDGEVAIYSLPDLEEVERFQAAHGVPTQLSLDRSERLQLCIWKLGFFDENRLVASHTFPSISIWDLGSSERIKAMTDYDLPKPPIVKNGLAVVHAGKGKIQVISGEGEVVSEHRHAETMYRLSFAGLGRDATIACTQNAGTVIRVWNAKTGELLAEQPCRANEPFAVSETMLACVHPETRHLTFYELPTT